MDAALKSNLDTVRGLLTQVFLSLGNALCVADPTLDEEEGKLVVSFPRLGQYIILNAPVPVRTVGGVRIVPGYVVGYVKTIHGGRRRPDDCEEVDTLRTQSLRNAVEEFAELFVRRIVNAQFDR